MCSMVSSGVLMREVSLDDRESVGIPASSNGAGSLQSANMAIAPAIAAAAWRTCPMGVMGARGCPHLRCSSEWIEALSETPGHIGLGQLHRGIHAAD